MSIVGTCAKNTALLVHVPKMIISSINDVFYSKTGSLYGTPYNLACVAARVQTTHWTLLQSTKTHPLLNIICCSLQVIPILRCISWCTVIIPQLATLMGVSHTTPWQTYAFQQDDKVIGRFFIITCVLSISTRIFLTITIRIGVVKRERMRVASTKN